MNLWRTNTCVHLWQHYISKNQGIGENQVGPNAIICSSQPSLILECSKETIAQYPLRSHSHDTNSGPS